MTEKRDIFDKIMALPVLRCFEKPYRKHKDVLLYLFFGVLSTVVSIGSFVLLDKCMNELIANGISWVVTVGFAYVTNRTWVFHSTARRGEIPKELLSFYSGRVLTLVMEETLLLVFVTWLGLNATVIKLIAQVAVVVGNYFISKLLVFRKK